MPDWFYRTVSQPILFRLPATHARNLALAVVGRLARLPLGPHLIDFLGHMRADARLRRSLIGSEFPTSVGLGPWLDPKLVAVEALSRFGGMLLASGWVFLLPALWGYRRNSTWLWWTLLIAGSIAYAAAITVHFVVEYLSFKHLFPAFGGFGLLLLGLILSYPYLCRRNPKPV